MDSFELSNCANPKCGICYFVPGYAPEIKWDDAHKKKTTKNLATLLNWIESAAIVNPEETKSC